MMKKEEWTYVSAKDQQKIAVTQVTPRFAKALVVMVHGMVEHQDRYDEFRQCLYEAKFASVAYDVRGHGRSLYNQELKGHFADEKGWDCVIDDLNGILDHVRSTTTLPIILFGHSLGSVMVRSYLNHYPHDRLRGVLLSGSPSYSPAIPLALNVLKTYNRFHSVQAPSPFLTDALFAPYRMAVKNAHTKFDWLSYRSENVEAYQKDDLCGFPFTLGAIEAMFEGFKDVYQTTHAKLNTTLPIHFISGLDDPCHLPKGLKPALMRMQQLGYSNVSMEYVEAARHEFLNEDNRKASMLHLVDLFDTWLS